MQQPQTSGWTAKLMIEPDTNSQPADGLLLTSITMTSPHNLYDLVTSDCVRACVVAVALTFLDVRAAVDHPDGEEEREAGDDAEQALDEHRVRDLHGHSALHANRR